MILPTKVLFIFLIVLLIQHVTYLNLITCICIISVIQISHEVITFLVKAFDVDASMMTLFALTVKTQNKTNYEFKCFVLPRGILWNYFDIKLRHITAQVFVSKHCILPFQTLIMGLVLRLRTILIIFGCLGYTIGHAVFKTYIPNGESVLNPFCKCGVGSNRYSTWQRVGHLFPNGEYSHALNPFGVDFKKNDGVSNHLFKILVSFFSHAFENHKAILNEGAIMNFYFKM